MNEQTDHAVIRRKAGAGRPPSEGAGMSPAKAFRLALSKAAEDELHLAALVLGVQEQRLGQAALLDGIGDNRLLILLEGPQETKGVATFDAQLLAAVVEVQTTGQVAHTEAALRKPTRTDSVMCETVLERSLKEFETHLAGETAARWATGFRFGTQIESTRLLGLALEDVNYRTFHISLDLADGAKQGELMIALPADGCGGGQTGCGGTGGAKTWAKSMENTVCASHVEIIAVLHRLDVPLAQATGFKIGDLLSVPKSAISEVSLEGLDGRVVGQARLGQQNGFRALRILDDIDAPQLAGIGVSTEPALAESIDAPPVDIPLGDETGVDMMAPIPDIEMAPMEEPADIPMAAMPMDLEIG